MAKRELTAEDLEMLRQCSRRLGEFLRGLRVQEGLGQESASLSCRFDNKAFWRMERGDVMPRLHTLLVLAAAFRLSPAQCLRQLADAFEGILPVANRRCAARIPIEGGAYEIQVWRDNPEEPPPKNGR